MALQRVEYKSAPAFRVSKLERDGKITCAQLASLERGIRYRLNQNESRRAMGVEKTEHYFVR